jgi:hypothetical protein
MRAPTLLLTVLSICLGASAVCAQQMADPQFDSRVESPAYTKNFPRVLFDEAHNNVDNTHGRYKPFVDLLFNDGYHLTVNRQSFTKALLAPVKILVIVNPLGSEDVDDEGADAPAFTGAECEAVSEWVKSGGALLFVVDSGPFASAAETLATSLGVELGKSELSGAAADDKELESAGAIVYSRQNHSLAEHAIVNGRNETERLNRIIVFGGQSLKGPNGSETLLKLPTPADKKATEQPKAQAASPAAQAITFRLGKGRVVMLGDAAMLSAQVRGADNKPFGMNLPDIDNRQLALNIMHWLSGLLK